jgi:hypothetical protein
LLLRAELQPAHSGGVHASWQARHDLEDVVPNNPFAATIQRQKSRRQLERRCIAHTARRVA